MRGDEAEATEPTDAPSPSETHAPHRTPAQPIDSRPTRPRDSEETEVPSIDPATATPADEPHSFRDPATREDPHWRPGLLPRGPQGQPITEPSGTAASPPDDTTWTAATHDKPPPPRRTFDPMSMVAGVFFMGIAVTYLLDAGNAVDARPGIMLALAVIGVGASGFIGTLWSLLTRPRKPPSNNQIHP